MRKRNLNKMEVATEDQRRHAPGSVLVQMLQIGIIVGVVLSSPLWVAVLVVTLREGYPDLLGYFAVVATITGFMIGVGYVAVKRFSEPVDSHAHPGRDVAEFAAEKLLPEGLGMTFGIFKIVLWFASTDFSKQRPGRARRGLVGAAILAPVAVLVVSLLAAFQHSPTASDWFLIVSISALIGGSAGMLFGMMSDGL